MASLAEQFLKAGLVDKNNVKVANQDKNIDRFAACSRPMKR